jgi:hypothetical protein
MSSTGLNELVGKAVINENFHAALLDGRRAGCVAMFAAKLDPHEQAALLTIQASTLAEFAAAVERLIDQGLHGPVQLPVETPVYQPVRWPKPAASGAFMLHE